MVKLEDGAMVTMAQLVSGETTDDDGDALKFKKNETEAGLPTFTAKAKMNDGSNRWKQYTVDLTDTLVRVAVTIQESSQEVEPSPPDKPKEEEKDKDKDKDKAKAKEKETEARIIKTEVPQKKQKTL